MFIIQVLSSDLAEKSARVQSKEEGGLYEVTSTLRLFPVKSDHAGVYQCIASNTLGTVYSSRAAVTISGQCLLHLSIVIYLQVLFYWHFGAYMS